MKYQTGGWGIKCGNEVKCHLVDRMYRSVPHEIAEILLIL